MTGIPYRNDKFQPKLGKNRKPEHRWSAQYYDAVNKAVFANQCTPYMPTEPPQSIKEDIDKTGYVCKQCRDWYVIGEWWNSFFCYIFCLRKICMWLHSTSRFLLCRICKQ